MPSDDSTARVDRVGRDHDRQQRERADDRARRDQHAPSAAPRAAGRPPSRPAATSAVGADDREEVQVVVDECVQPVGKRERDERDSRGALCRLEPGESAAESERDAADEHDARAASREGRCRREAGAARCAAR